MLHVSGKNRLCIFALYVLGFAALSVCVICLLYKRSNLNLTFDSDYYWADKEFDNSTWFYEHVPAGWEYYLYIPPEYRNDRQNELARLPLVVVFHGANAKASSLRYGRFFTDDRVQNIRKCAVLVMHSRGDYFSDCHSMSLLIQNILLKNLCIDKTNIIGWGHSQGAKFVLELACYEKALFKAVICGSGYYQPTFAEYVKILPVQFYWKIAIRDKGIYEQGYKTGRRLSRLCRNSVNIELDSPSHFCVELNDKIPGTDRTFLDWFKSVVCD